MNPNRPKTSQIRPLASIPNKEGFTLIGVHKNGSEAELTVFVDANGNYNVPGYSSLIGWKLPP